MNVRGTILRYSVLRPAILWACACLLVCSTASFAAETLWTLGKPDGDYREFAIAGKHGEYPQQFAHDVVFRIGQSNTEKDWPFIQPGPGDAWAGARPHPFRIEFDLPSVPTSAWRLNLQFVSTHQTNPPVLEVNVNDQVRRKFPLPSGGSDNALTDPAAGRKCQLSPVFAPNCLRQGRNTITLTLVENSWLLYDAVALETGVPADGPDVADLEASATPFFRKENGEEKQAIAVKLNNAGIEGDIEARLTGAREAVQKASLVQGANAFYLMVKPLDRAQPLHLAVCVGARKVEVDFEGAPQRHWKVFVAPSAHTDIGYTDVQEKTFQRHFENNCKALDACEARPDFKWNLEVAFQAKWIEERDEGRFAQLLARAREGRIGMTGLCLNMLTGLCSGEEMAEVLGYAQRLSRANNFKIDAATLTDVPTAIGSLPSFLAHAGIKYFAEGCNVDRGPIWSQKEKPLHQTPFWWEGFDGSRILTIYTDAYSQAGAIGVTSSVEAVAQHLPGWLKRSDRPDYPADAIYINGAFSDNCAMDPRYAEVAAAWNQQWDFPKIIVSRVPEFFEYVEKNFGSALPVIRGDMGVYWEDGAASSAHETAVVRWAKNRLEAARGWYALASEYCATQEFPAEPIKQAWEAILYYDEHTWGAAGSIGDPEGQQTRDQWARKADFAKCAAEHTGELGWAAQQAILDLAAEKKAKNSGGAQVLIVPNALSWPRDILVTAKAPKAGKGQRVRDLAHGHVVVSQPDNDGVAFIAKNVPPLGYRAFRLEAEALRQPAALLKQGKDTYHWQTQDFRFVIDPHTGAIAQLEDLRLKRDWVEEHSGYGLNQYLYVPGGEKTGLIHPGVKPPESLSILTHSVAHVELLENGPVRAVLLVRRTGDQVDDTDSYIILEPGRRLDFVNVLHKKATTAKEAGYFAFPFRLSRPDEARAYVELPYGIVEADREQQPGACRDWYSTNSFVAVTDGQVTACLVTPQAPLVSIGDIVRGTWRGKIEAPRNRLFAYVFNNYWHTNYKASQGGDMLFAFSVRLTAGGFDPVDATHFGWERLASMLDPGTASKPDFWRRGDTEGLFSDAVSEPQDSFLQLKGDPVVVGGLTRENDNLLVRLYNPASRTAEAKLFLRNCSGGSQTDLFGKQEHPLQSARNGLKVTVPPRSFITVAPTAKKTQ